MLARSATIFKWTLYTLAGLVWAVVQAAFLQRVTVWGVIPFLYPRMGCGHVRDPAGAVRLPAVEPAYDLAVPPGLSPRSC